MQDPVHQEISVRRQRPAPDPESGGLRLLPRPGGGERSAAEASRVPARQGRDETAQPQIHRGRRMFDLTVAWLLLILLAPLFLLVAAATLIESRGPVFFRQRRALGHHDPPFELFKFRSMVQGADESRESLEPYNESDGPLFKLRNDPRTTRVGRFLRRHSLDELPQLFNVIRGEMSLVGPRPLPVGDLERFRGEAELDGLVRLRACSRPGMTGLWQVSGRSDLGFRDMLLLDLYYIENRTLLLDLKLLWYTIPVVITGKGAA